MSEGNLIANALSSEDEVFCPLLARIRKSYKEALQRIFPTAHLSFFVLSEEGIRKSLRCKVKLFCIKALEQRMAKNNIDFVCGKDSFRDIEPVVHSLRFYGSLTEFSEEGIEFDEERIEFSRLKYSGERNIEIINHGNREGPVKIRFTGPIVNPYIKNKTANEMIQIDEIIKEEEYLEIETEPGRRQIMLRKNGIVENGMHYLDIAYSFWKLKEGKNLMEIVDESPGEGSEATFEFYEEYFEA